MSLLEHDTIAVDCLAAFATLTRAQEQIDADADGAVNYEFRVREESSEDLCFSIHNSGDARKLASVRIARDTARVVASMTVFMLMPQAGTPPVAWSACLAFAFARAASGTEGDVVPVRTHSNVMLKDVLVADCARQVDASLDALR
jgi:hypothetical protein